MSKNQESKKFENHEELIARVNQKLKAVEKRINEDVNEHYDYVKVSFDFKEPSVLQETEGGKKKKTSGGLKKYIYTLEVYDIYDDEDGREYIDESPRRIVEKYPEFKTSKEYEDSANITAIENEFTDNLYEEYMLEEINRDPGFLDEVYEEEYGVKYSVNYQRFPNDKDFIVKILTKLVVEQRKMNDHFEPFGLYCVMSFDFASPLNSKGEPIFDIMNYQYENVKQLKLPRYMFTAEICFNSRKPGEESEKVTSLADCRGHSTKAGYEDYVDWFCAKVSNELSRAVYLATVIEKQQMSENKNDKI